MLIINNRAIYHQKKKILIRAHVPTQVPTHAHMYVDTGMHVCTHNYAHVYPTAVRAHTNIHTPAHNHPHTPWKKPFTLRHHRVHVSPSGIINTMLMNTGLGPEASEERREEKRQKQTERDTES